ncbi:MAG: hypothetical protein ACK5Q5_18965 [Planctomycetaceae bacterium]
MPNVIERATIQALAVIKAKTGVPVTYRRNADSLALTAIHGTTRATNETSNGTRIRTDSTDYLIDAVELDFGFGPVEPAIGDVITDGDREFEVVSLIGGEPPWTWHDPYHIRLRIHVVET